MIAVFVGVLLSMTVYVDDYVAQGQACQESALQQAVADAGDGGIVVLSSAYTICAPVHLDQPNQLWTGGGTVRRVDAYGPDDPGFYMLRIWAPHVTIDGIVIDGNRKGNDYTMSWALHQSVFVDADHVTITNCHLRHAQADHIGGSDHVGLRVVGNLMTHSNGAAMHLSAVRTAMIEGNRIYNSNIQAERVGHAEGAITFSLYNDGVTIVDNVIKRSNSAYAIGGIYGGGSGGNRNIVIVNNRAHKTNGLYAYSIGDYCMGLTLHGNRWRDARALVRGRDGGVLSCVNAPRDGSVDLVSVH